MLNLSQGGPWRPGSKGRAGAAAVARQEENGLWGETSFSPLRSGSGPPRPLQDRFASTERAFRSRIPGRKRPTAVYVPNLWKVQKASTANSWRPRSGGVGGWTQQHHAPTYPTTPLPGGWADPSRNRGGTKALIFASACETRLVFTDPDALSVQPPPPASRPHRPASPARKLVLLGRPCHADRISLFSSANTKMREI
jgi:hypothetical protein